jgi:hypothetical protein
MEEIVMRDLRPGEVIREGGDVGLGLYVETYDGTTTTREPLVWDSVLSFARWWVRQSELGLVEMPPELRIWLAELFNGLPPKRSKGV